MFFAPHAVRTSREGILLSKGSELCINISPENWCQHPFKV